MRDQRAPLYEAVMKYINQRPVRLHVPGHKGGEAFLGHIAGQAEQPFGQAGHANQATLYGYSDFARMLSFDVTELSGLDDLHEPTEAIREAQILAAECFGADDTHFLIGGSTVGNIALILSACNPGDLIIVQRNVHKSVIHALMLAEARAVFLPPRVDLVTGLPSSPDPTCIEQALRTYPQATAVFLTNPSYYGLGTDLSQIATLCHSSNKLLLVDEAHGAHYGFHQELPPSAMQCGADAAVQSTHKMLTAMTMGAMLHVRGERIQRDKLKKILTMLQSSSPSYPILVSLDLARLWVQEHGRRWLQDAMQALKQWSSDLARLERFELTVDKPNDCFYETKDPFKAAVRDRSGQLSGFQLKSALEELGCYPELADSEQVLLAFSLASSTEDANRLIHAFEQVKIRYPEAEKKELQGPVTNTNIVAYAQEISAPVQFSMRHIHTRVGADSAYSRPIALSKAAGHSSAEMVIPYPPGIPLLYPGEIITAEMAAYLQRLADSGASFQGVSDPALHTLQVVRDSQVELFGKRE
jgi:arginine decarboxylase